jgi:hypothetical protein
MSKLGAIVVNLEAQTAAFTAGFKKAEEAIHSLEHELEALKGMAEKAFAFAGIEMGISAVKEWIMSAVDAGAAAYRLSSAMRMSTEALTGLQYAARMSHVATEDLNAALNKMEKNLGKAMGGGEQAAALEELGLSARNLINLKPDEQFTKIASGLAEIQNPAQQALLAFQVFGKNYAALLPLINKGPEGIREAMDEAKKFGVALSDVDASKLEKAEESFKKVDEAINGAKNQLAIAFAPALQAIAEKILSLLPAADKMRSGFMSALRGIAVGIGYTVDAWHVLKLAAQGVSYGIVGGIELVIIGIRKLAEGITWVANKLGADWHVPEWMGRVEGEVDQWRKQIGKEMGETLDELSHPASERYGQAIDDLIEKTDALAQKSADAKNKLSGAYDDAAASAIAAAGVIAKLKEEIDTFGMNKSEKQLFDLKQLPNLDSKYIDQAAKYVAILEQQKAAHDANKKAMEEMHKLVKRVNEDSKTALDKYTDQLKELNRLRYFGFINEETYQKAKKKYHDEAAQKESEGQAPHKYQAAAISRRMDFYLPADMFGKPSAPLDKLNEVEKKALEEHVKHTDMWKDMWNWAREQRDNLDKIVTF